MSESMITAVGVVLLAGVFQGSFLYPSKYMKGWAWENYWLIFALTAYLVCPWVVAAYTIPHLGELYLGLPFSALLPLMLFGLGWGLGALTFGLGVEAVGLALGFAIILGISATSGTLIPLIVLNSGQLAGGQAVATGAALVLILVGVGICSWAGKWKETGGEGRSYGKGVAICVASGLLSACGNLGFAFGGVVSSRAQELGAAEHLSGNALWTLLALPLFLCNAGYAGWLLYRNGSAAHFRKPGGTRRWLLGCSMGVMWMAGMGLYGVGARKLGDLGPSLGWALLMTSVVVVANALGLASGEWKDAPAASRRQLFAGIGVLLLAICTLGYANGLRP